MKLESDSQCTLFFAVVVQRAADEHHLVGGAAPPDRQRLPQDAQSFHARQHVFHLHPFLLQLPVAAFVSPVQRPPARFLAQRLHLGRSVPSMSTSLTAGNSASTCVRSRAHPPIQDQRFADRYHARLLPSRFTPRYCRSALLPWVTWIVSQRRPDGPPPPPVTFSRVSIRTQRVGLTTGGEQ